jgi:hypothetical protein
MLVAIASTLSPGHPRSVAPLCDGDSPTVVPMVGADIHASTALAYINAYLSDGLRCSNHQWDSTKDSCSCRGNKRKSLHDVHTHTPLWFCRGLNEFVPSSVPSIEFIVNYSRWFAMLRYSALMSERCPLRIRTNSEMMTMITEQANQ